MIKLLIIVFALIVALGAGTGGLIHFGVVPDFTGMIVPPQEGNGPVADAPEEEGPPVRVDPVFLDMQPFLVPVIRNGVLQRNMYVSLRLLVEPGQEQKARLYRAQLQDVYLRALYDHIPKQLEKRQTLDLLRMKARLEHVTGRAVGEGVIKEVVVQSVFER